MRHLSSLLLVGLIATASASAATNVSGNLTADASWRQTDGPYVVIANVTVNAGVTLTIEPGVIVKFNPGTSLTVNGRLLAEGGATNRIRFARATTASAWSRITLNNGPRESRIAYADIDGANGRGNITANFTQLYLDHIVWTNTTVQLLTVDDTSLVVKNSRFPTIQNDELLHFNVMPPNGHALIMSNFFGTTSGYNDIIDLTGGNRPGPIAQFIGNVFSSAVDDVLDLDGTDAHIEGNVFLHVQQDAARASSSNPISTGADGSNTSELVICRNLFFNCDHGLLVKDGGSALHQNNTVVKIFDNPTDSNLSALVNFSEPNRSTPGGRGAVLDGDLVWDVANNRLLLNFNSSAMFFTASHSLFPVAVSGPGNLTADPQFVDDALVNITPENIREALALQSGSPARGSGPNGLDMGALVPGGASISGEPEGVTADTNATLRIAGPGIYAYRWKLNDGPWSTVVPLTNSLLISPAFLETNSLVQLTGLTNGTYTLFALGMNSAGIWQGTNFGDAISATNAPTVSKTWTVRTAPVDTDRDGMPDDYELAHGLDKAVDDAGADLDGDGQSNLDEYLDGTNPQNPASSLRVETLHPDHVNGTQLTFIVVPDHSYTMQFRDSLVAGNWTRLADFPVQSTGGLRQVTDADSHEQSVRFYRLVTPQLP